MNTQRQSNNNNLNKVVWTQWEKEATQRAIDAETAIMPSLDHVSYRDYEHIYEPAEDTYLLLDAIQYDLKNIYYTHHPTTNDNNTRTTTTTTILLSCLEIGCGSGVVSTFAQTQWNLLLQQQQNNTNNNTPDPSTKQQRIIRMINFATDINSRALAVTKRTFHENNNKNNNNNNNNNTASNNGTNNSSVLELIQCDLATPLLIKLYKTMDIILFNPPYVPTDDDEIDTTGGIAAAWAGGINGRRVMDRFLPQLATLLQRPYGVAYMVTVDDNQPFELALQLRNDYGLSMKPLLRRRAKNELLTIQKITWL